MVLIILLVLTAHLVGVLLGLRIGRRSGLKAGRELVRWSLDGDPPAWLRKEVKRQLHLFDIELRR